MLPRQGYAPTPHSYVPNTALSASINLDEEVTLTSTRAERDLQDSLAELFSIIVTLDELEKAFIKDAVSEAEYTEICERSLRQYNALLADDTIAREFGGLEEFQAKWDAGMPSTITTPASAAAAGPSDRNNTSGVLILEATQDFITFLDAVKLGLLSKDQLHPLLSDVIQSVNKVTDKDFENRGKIVQWLITLNQMKASEELSEQQARELDMDIQQAYQGFRRTLT
ncbi:Vacuolar protein sorting-associated protein 28 [Beauveria bassiana]|uniref:Vacuolar protein sorting-associated protein 28 n=1 Tax=Beauveria bassiana TaxID=176275 RepID=A0A2N6NUQ6_BEABA|nr:Vacuolar protein sorting-associated protein 28 [Beauveria bassiana]